MHWFPLSRTIRNGRFQEGNRESRRSHDCTFMPYLSHFLSRPSYPDLAAFRRFSTAPRNLFASTPTNASAAEERAVELKFGWRSKAIVSQGHEPVPTRQNAPNDTCSHHERPTLTQSHRSIRQAERRREATFMVGARPPLRWAGSKRRSLVDLRAAAPKVIERYVEPFAGSACLAFAALPKQIVLGDINNNLVEFYTHLRDNPKSLFELYISIPRTEERYYQTRTEYNTSNPSIERAAKFLFLNRNCFNGIYRVNSKGEFNVPWGGDKVGAPLTVQIIAEASKALANAKFVCSDFEELIDCNLVEGTFFYIDPPYASNEKRVFREYHENSFSTLDWDRLVASLERIDRSGAFFLISYAGTKLAEKCLERWSIGHLDVTRNVGGFRSTRRKHREFIGTNFRAPE